MSETQPGFGCFTGLNPFYPTDMAADQLNSRKNSSLIAIGIGLVFVVIIVVQFFSGGNPDPYQEKVAQQRRERDLSVKNNPDLFSKEERAKFKGLIYFDIDPAYRVEATLVKDQPTDTLILATTTGEPYQVARIGQLVFTLQGRECRLAAYKYLDNRVSDFFVPFRDLTSGTSTYGGGRYLDVPAKQPIVLDFNTAYNPYCVYNEGYTCPLPPKENKLPLEVAAGEKLYQP